MECVLIMKYIGFWDIKNFENVSMKMKGLNKLSKEYPKQFPKNLDVFQMIGEDKCFSILEADNPDQLLNFQYFFSPDASFTFLPIMEFDESNAIREKSRNHAIWI